VAVLPQIFGLLNLRVVVGVVFHITVSHWNFSGFYVCERL